MVGTTRVKLTVCKDATTTGIAVTPDPAANGQPQIPAGQGYVSLYGYDLSDMTFQATVSGTGAVSATVQIEVSNDGIGWLIDSTATLVLSGTTVASKGFTSSAAWQFVRANITAISGTGAKVTVSVGG